MGGGVTHGGSWVGWAAQAVARFPPLHLAVAIMTTVAALSFLWLATEIATVLGHGMPLSVLWGGAADPLSWAVMIWPGLGPWGLGILLQLVGQRGVNPTQAQLILATDPLWTTAFAGLLSAREQELSGLGWLGAALILLASLIGSLAGGVRH